MIGIYFNGARNTKHYIETLISLPDASTQYFPVECTRVENVTAKHNSLALGYPTRFSNAPFMVRDFIDKRHSLWNGKAIFILNTIGLFSDGGAGCTARLLKKYGTTVLDGLQAKMPNSVCDSRLLRKSTEESRRVVREADKCIALVAEQIR